MKKIKEALRKVGEKNAVKSITPSSFPFTVYQPKPPAKIQRQINKDK